MAPFETRYDSTRYWMDILARINLMHTNEIQFCYTEDLFLDCLIMIDASYFETRTSRLRPRFARTKNQWLEHTVAHSGMIVKTH